MTSKTKDKMKILFTGGGTGGHVFPIIAVVREIKRLIPEAELFYVGPADRWSALYLSQEQIKIKPVLAGKLRRYFTFEAVVLNFIDIFKFLIGFFQSFFWVYLINPDVIFSKGGFGCLTVVLSGKLLSVPIFLHESDSIPGAANRYTAKMVTEVFVSFEKTKYFEPEKMIWTGNPIRRELLEGSDRGAKERLKLIGDRPVLFVLGGSQGSQRINDLMLLALPQLLKDFEIIHQCGAQNYEKVLAGSRVVIKDQDLRNYYHPLGFLEENELRDAYYVADIIVSRAGAAAIFTIAALGKASILIPLKESAQNHQLQNAYYFAENGACLVIEEDNLTPQFFVERLSFLMTRSEEVEKMKRAAKDFAKPMAAKVIARYLLEYLMR